MVFTKYNVYNTVKSGGKKKKVSLRGVEKLGLERISSFYVVTSAVGISITLYSAILNKIFTCNVVLVVVKRRWCPPSFFKRVNDIKSIIKEQPIFAGIHHRGNGEKADATTTNVRRCVCEPQQTFYRSDSAYDAV